MFIDLSLAQVRRPLSLRSSARQTETVSLSEFRGRPVVLAFYPADFSPVCGDQMALYNEMLNEFQELEAELVGLSGRWRVVPRGLRQAEQTALPASSSF